MNEFENNPLDLLASVEAEQNIIGGLLLEPTAMAKCRNLTAEKFYQVRHRIIFAALKAMAAENLRFNSQPPEGGWFQTAKAGRRHEQKANLVFR